ncbi:MAG: HEAT repeat domain-containing protein [Acidobacteria bacterium]|nr:HEAT repeat domain-containing protein [Acidobacteriota bacterium]
MVIGGNWRATPRIPNGFLAVIGWLLLVATAGAQVEAENQLRDPDPKVRERAVRELGESNNPAYVPVLGQIVRDADEKVRMTVVKSLIRMGTEASLSPLCLATRDGLPEIRYLAIDGIVNFYLPGYVDTGFGGLFRSVGQRVQNLFSDVDTAIVDADTKLSPEVIETLRKTVTGAPHMQTRVRAARALGILRAREAVPDLLEAAFSNQVDLIAEVLRAFQKIQDTSVGPRIMFLLKYPQKSIQQRAARTLGLLRTYEATPELRNLLENSDDKDVRIAALDALAFMPIPETGPAFQSYLYDKEMQMRASSALALGRLQGANYSGILEQARQKERDTGVRLALAFGMVAHGRLELIDELVSNLGSRVREGEARPYLIELARQDAVRKALYPKLYSPDSDIRKNLCAVLAASGDSTSISYLEVLLRDSNAGVVQEASRAIRILRSRGM